MARAALAVLACCVFLRSSSAVVVSSSSQDKGAVALQQKTAVPTPIQRVVQLLQEMKTTLERDAADDQSKYDKMVCWCDTNEKEKTKSIADADAKITELLELVESCSARDGELGAKIAALKQDLIEKKESLARAVAIREKEHAVFYQEEKELVEGVTMLKSAIAVLAKHNEGLLQMTPALQASLSTTMRWAALKHEEMQEMNQQQGGNTHPVAVARPIAAVLLSVTASQGAMADTVLTALRGADRPSTVEIPVDMASKILANAAAPRASASSFAQAPKFADYKSYSPQSSQVYGILKQLKEDFEANLSESQKAELQAQQEFEEVKAAAEKQIESMTVQLDDTEAEYSTNIKALSDAKEDLEVMRETRSADVKFLSDLRLECQDLNHQWETRSKSRSEEIRAVSETIAILTADDSRDLFNKKMGTELNTGAASFLQLQASRNAAVRRSAAALLMRAAQPMIDFDDLTFGPAEEKPHAQLAAMAVRVQIDSFAKVKQAIDDMVTDLKAQQQEEVKHKAFCNSGLRENEKETYTTEQLLEEIESQIKGLKVTIKKLTEEIVAAHEEIKSTEVQIKIASESRKGENAIFKEEVSDQRAVQNLLDKAISRLRSTFKVKAGNAFNQESPVSPVKFQPYKQNANGSPVIGLIEQIVEDSKAVEQEAITGEQAAQKAYEGFIADATASIKALNNAIESKTKAKAAAKVDLEEAEAHRDSTKERLEDLNQVAADLHADCDYTLKNFDIRQKARMQEIEALQNAKALLSGMVEG